MARGEIRGSMLVTHPRNAVSHPGYSTRRSNTSTAEATPIPDPGGYSSVTTVAPTCATSRGHPRRANKYARSSSHAVQLHANHGVLCNTIRIRPRCVQRGVRVHGLRYTTHRGFKVAFTRRTRPVEPSTQCSRPKFNGRSQRWNEKARQRQDEFMGSRHTNSLLLSAPVDVVIDLISAVVS